MSGALSRLKKGLFLFKLPVVKIASLEKKEFFLYKKKSIA